MLLPFILIMCLLSATSFLIKLIKKLNRQKREIGNPNYPTLEDAGLSQWKDFTLTSTPDIIKKGVTDISKYYA